MIKEWLDSYKPENKDDALQALREIMQEVALAGLERAGFFERAAFYGGTALRIFYGLNRYSEDHWVARPSRVPKDRMSPCF